MRDEQMRAEFDEFLRQEAPRDYDASNDDAWHIWQAAWNRRSTSRAASGEVPEALRKWAALSEPEPTMWHVGYEAARGWVKMQIDPAPALASTKPLIQNEKVPENEPIVAKHWPGQAEGIVLTEFMAWAIDNLGQGYILEREDGTFLDPVTRWAFAAWRARGCSAIAALSKEKP